MNTKQLVIAISFLSAIGTASAQQNAITDNSGFIGASPADQSSNAPGKTRAQVIEELKQAQADGWTDSVAFVGYSPSSQTRSSQPGKTRAEVLAELKQAQEQGMSDSVGLADAPVAHLQPVSAPVQLSSH